VTPDNTAVEAVKAAVKVAAGLGINAAEPVVLADGANVIVHLSPSPVVAKVAASTPEIRPDTGAWLQRELDVARWLHGRAVPVAEPSPLVPATVRRGDGHVMSFWRYLPPAGPERPDEETVGSMLRDLHEALRCYPAKLPELAPLGDVAAYLARPQTRLDAAGKAALAAANARLTADLDQAAPQQAPTYQAPTHQAPTHQAPTHQAPTHQALHGDAGVGNLMATDHGWVWHDFEDACTGPVAWDLAASTASPRLDAARILAAYGTPVDPGQLAVCQQLRRLNLTVWYNLYAERRPELAARAAELVALWPAP
jgi:Ser/Thr protein kinase RdoA (MazF antagonist)